MEVRIGYIRRLSDGNHLPLCLSRLSLPRSSFLSSPLPNGKMSAATFFRTRTNLAPFLKKGKKNDVQLIQ